MKWKSFTCAKYKDVTTVLISCAFFAYHYGLKPLVELMT